MGEKAYAPHELRVIEERDELAKKLAALSDFICCKGSTIFSNLDVVDQDLLKSQAAFMLEYKNILDARILRF